jgi:class 3 adenylate cyclase/TolB-like protein
VREPQTERRLAAVLAADVVGYTRLMGRDEAGTHARLKAIRRELVDPSVKRHGGRVVKSTGDGVLVEFPSAIEAASCALEVQRTIFDRNVEVPEDKRIVFRIGLNVGDLIIDDGDIFGDGVNIAARLERLCVPGGICVSRAVRDQIRDKAPFAFEGLGEQLVKNVERPVRAFQLRLDRITSEEGQSSSFPSTSNQRLPRRLAVGLSVLIAAAPSAFAGWRAWTGAAVMFLVLAGAAGAWWFSRDQSPPVKDHWAADVRVHVPAARSSIAVLPFTSMMADGNSDYFADGLTEDIIAALGRFRDLTVISRSGVFALKGKNPTSVEIGRILKVSYLVEGSVRRAADRVRITVSLTDTLRNILLWSEKFDVELKDLFSVQDQITRQITGALAVHVSALELEHAMAKPPRNLEAYDLVLRGGS